MSNIQFWLTFDNSKEKIRLPVNPESLQISTEHSFEDVTVSGLGSITVIGNKGLKTFSLSSFFPKEFNPIYCEYNGFPDPWDIIETLEKWRDSKLPMRLIVTNTPINIAVTLQNFDYEAEKFAANGDISFSMELREYRFVKLSKTNINKNMVSIAIPKNHRPKIVAPTTSYTVRKGDSLWKISRRVYGSGSKWRTIYNANKKLIGTNPNLIKIGQKLVIPND